MWRITTTHTGARDEVVSKFYSFYFYFFFTNYLQGNIHDDDGKRPNEEPGGLRRRTQGLETCRAPR